ncbi:MAG: hypothetical protein ACLPYS_03120 [Vulcanimicrobiaceae bacterium]
MLEYDRVASIEREVRELTEGAARAAAERTACRQLIEESRGIIESKHPELPAAEAAEKDAQRAAREAVRRRAEVESGLNEILERDEPARARRREAGQRAESFRAAAAYAGAALSDAMQRGDKEQAQRERLAAASAAQHVADAEAAADEERLTEESLAGPRADFERLLASALAHESNCSANLTQAQHRAAEVRNAIDRAEIELADAEARLERIQRERERIASEHAAADERLQEVRRRAHFEIASRVAQLRTSEQSALREREELERLRMALGPPPPGITVEPLPPAPRPSRTPAPVVAPPPLPEAYVVTAPRTRAPIVRFLLGLLSL